MVAHACDLSPWEMVEGESDIWKPSGITVSWDQPELHEIQSQEKDF